MNKEDITEMLDSSSREYKQRRNEVFAKIEAVREKLTPEEWELVVEYFRS